MLRRAILAAAVALVPAFGFAHSLDNGPHGGEVEDANPGPALHFETVLKGTAISVYMTDESGTPIPSAGVTGSVTVLANKQKTSIDLAPGGANMMAGKGSFSADPAMRALVALTIGGVKQQALFSRLAEQTQ